MTPAPKLREGTRDTRPEAAPGRLESGLRGRPGLRVGWSLVALLLVACHPRTESPPPDILLVVADTLRAADVGFLGSRRETTPRLDRLAASAAVFTHAFSAGGNTTTAMPAVMTGRFAYTTFRQPWDEQQFGMDRFYLDGDDAGLPRGLPTLAQRLAARGYATAGVVANGYLTRRFQFDRGFRDYSELGPLPGDGYARGDRVASEAVTLIRSVARRRRSGTREPFFLYLHFMDAHGPYEPPPTLLRQFGGQPLPAEEFRAAWKRWNDGRDLVRGGRLDRFMRASYAGGVRFIDQQIARILGALEAQGLAENTVVVFTADHGEEFLEHGGTGHRGTLYSEILHVPLLVRLPGQPGRRIDGLARNFDLMPTLLELAGDDPAGLDLDAVSLVRALQGGPPPRVDGAFAEGFPDRHTMSTLQFRLIEHDDGRREFFDLRADPGERSDLAAAGATLSAEQEAAFREMRAELARRVERFERTRTAVHSRRTLDDETIRRLRALGYLR